MKKIIEFGKVSYNGKSKSNLVTVELELKERNGLPVFTASANLYNSQKTDLYMGGQCLDSIYRDYAKELDNLPLYRKILGLWERNHLNDMNAGTAEQTEAVNAYIAQGNSYDYAEVCGYLKSVGLYEVEHNGEPYKYGHGWIYRPISEEDLADIKTILED